jgi:hypothetical protein
MPNPHEMSYGDIGNILVQAMKDPAFRNRLLADPKAALADEPFVPGPAALRFFTTLSAGNFAAAAADYRNDRDALDGAADMEV